MSDTNKFALLVSQGRTAPSSLQASAQSSSKRILICLFRFFQRASPFIPASIDISALFISSMGASIFGVIAIPIRLGIEFIRRKFIDSKNDIN